MSIQDKKITDAAVAAAGVQSRPDKLTGTAAENKKVFDNLVTAVVKTALNGLIDELTGTGAAAQLGIQTIPGFSAADIQTALEEIVAAMQSITQGSVTDGSITLAKLAADVTAAALGGAAASHTHGAADVSSGVLDIARIPVLTGDKLPDGIVTEGKLGAAVVTSEKLAALAVLATHIAKGAVTGQKIADDAITMAHLSADVKYTKTYWGSTPSELLAEWNRSIVFPDSASGYFAITPNIAASLPVGYRCRIVSYLQTELRWGDFGDSSIEIISLGEGKGYYSRSGTITIPQNRYVDIERPANSIWILSGSYADRMISSGTAAPSGGNDGDVYIQYS